MSGNDPEFKRFARALALTESNDKETAWGDGKSDKTAYLACGRWQMHPAFFQTWTHGVYGVEASWDDVFESTLLHFWTVRRQFTDNVWRIAMEFHLGIRAVMDNRWDDDYAERFREFYDELVD
jgi:hypothetical protein